MRLQVNLMVRSAAQVTRLDDEVVGAGRLS